MEDSNYSFKSKKIRVLIISDRLLNQASAMAKYLSSTGSIDVVGLAENKQQALSIAHDHSFDYLIIVGYLKMEYTYEVIAELQKQQKEFLPVQWAILDSLIVTFCQRYKIPLKFERTLPITDFVSFLVAHKSDPIPHSQ
ncbi:MAG TPA: hypothetical protein VM577_10035 [Anaerovoracaceae bacterium]|nr:hypothetical protein [Anaerovoracaceae bacterium]